MAQINHTIVWCRAEVKSSSFLSEMLGLPPPRPVARQHYAFLVQEAKFDAVMARVAAGGIPYRADPGQTRVGRIDHQFDGRGVTFQDPDGHLVEAITQPYEGTPLE